MSNARCCVFGFALLLSPVIEAECLAPPVPVIQLLPAMQPGVGQTYAIGWSEVTGGTGSYVIERSMTSDFTSVEQQRIGVNGASFTSSAEGLYFHRVRAVPACDATKESANSPSAVVTVVSGAAVVVFSAQPQAVLVGAEDSLDAVHSSFSVENVGRASVTVSVDSLILGPTPFFTIKDPAGGDIRRLTLLPRTPRQLDIRFSGVPVANPATFEAIISISGVSETLAVTPYAYVNLRPGASAPTPTFPRFQINGKSTTFLSLPPYSTARPDSERATITVDIANDGPVAMDVAGEVGPEGWLSPKRGWNASAIAPNSSLTVELIVDRSRANRASPLPRYTYFTVRSRSGRTARLLVIDNDLVVPESVALPTVSPDTHSYIVTSVISAFSSLLRTELRVANVSNIPVSADVYYIEHSAAQPLRANISVPGNDVVAFHDVLSQLFGQTSAEGQVEIRTREETAQFLTVSANTNFGGPVYSIPVLVRGEGAREAVPHAISGVRMGPSLRHIFTLVETSRQPGVTPIVTVTLFDSDGKVLRTRTFTYASAVAIDTQLIDFFTVPDDFTVDSGRLEISVTGSGAVAATLSFVALPSGEVTATYVAQPITTQAQATVIHAVESSRTQSYAVLDATNGVLAGLDYTTLLDVTSIDSPADLFLSFHSSSFSPRYTVGLTLTAGRTVEFHDVLSELFKIPAELQASGTLFIQSTAPLNLFGRLIETLPNGHRDAGGLPVIPQLSDAVTSATHGLQRPVYFDGAEQSIDQSRGSRWSLTLSEISGAPATVSVRLYEAGNRTSPIADSDFSLQPREHKNLDTVFAAMGLDEPGRRKDRRNVEIVVSPKTGTGRVAAVAVGFDNLTGTAARYVLTPNGGIPASGASRTSTRLLNSPGHRRSAAH